MNIRNWKIDLERLRVADAQEESIFSDGDEPYFVVIGFRSRFNTPDSTQVFWSGFLNEDWADGVDDGNERNIPQPMGEVSFPGVRTVTAAEILSGNLPELVGAIAIAIESDLTPFGIIEDKINELASSLEEELRRLIEEGELDLTNPGPDLEMAILNVQSSIEPDFMESLEIFLSSFADPDDIIDMHTFLFAAVDPALENFIPPSFSPDVTIGVLTEQQFTIGEDPIVFSGDGATYEVTTSISSNPVSMSSPSPVSILAEGVSREVLESAPQSGFNLVFDGSADGLVPNPGLDRAGLGVNESGELFGAVLTLGDFNNDGFDDLAVEVPGEALGSDSQSGFVLVFDGSADGLVPNQGLDQAGLGTNEFGDFFGAALPNS